MLLCQGTFLCGNFQLLAWILIVVSNWYSSASYRWASMAAQTEVFCKNKYLNEGIHSCRMICLIKVWLDILCFSSLQERVLSLPKIYHVPIPSAGNTASESSNVPSLPIHLLNTPILIHRSGILGYRISLGKCWPLQQTSFWLYWEQFRWKKIMHTFSSSDTWYIASFWWLLTSWAFLFLILFYKHIKKLTEICSP